MRCESCHHRNRLDTQTLECRRFPPQVSIVLVPQRTLTGDALAPQSFAGFPLVHEDQFCGEWGAAGTRQDRKIQLSS